MMRKESAGLPGGTEVALDAADCLTLQQVLQAFNSSISEEHAWALFYQGSRCFQKCIDEGTAYCLPTKLAHVVLHKDGTVHPRTLMHTGDDRSREKFNAEHELVVNLAIVVYQALDYTHGEDEERLMSPELESLITEMTANNAAEDDEECEGALSEGSETSEGGRADTDDEGIERDSEPAPRRRRSIRRFMLKDVVERCIWHCGGSGARLARDNAAAHYRAVCRALVAEALELASFLARVRVHGARHLGAAEDSAMHLDTLHFSDWARFWMQVIGDLRMGVKLKKVNYSRTPIEYELTPYEILMDDIRSRRYTLRKVDGAIPQSVKKDAHAMILEFIRSRPPLKKASERKLPPRRREVTPREQLLASIQVGRQLRPTPYSRRLSTSGSGSGPGGGEPHAYPHEYPHPHARRTDVTPHAPHAPPQRRLIKATLDNDDDDDDDDTETCASPETCAPQPYPRHTAPQQTPPKPWKRTVATGTPRAPPRTRISHDEYHQFCDETLESYDLATQCPSRRASMRRHTITHSVPPTDGAQSMPHSRPNSRASCGGATSLASSDADAQLGDLSWSRSSLQDELIKSVSGSPTHQHKQWQDAIMSDDRLSLTLEEIVHIRSVLTKAELEVLPVEGRVKEDVEKRRVCFLCLKTRFGIFGPWGQKCKLCKKTVCQKCCSKMRIPTEHFAHVPVALLSPSLLPSPEDEQQSFPRSLMARLVSPERSVSIRTSSNQMRIPTEHFAHVPVALLSPSLLPSPEDEQQSFPRSLMARLVSPERSVSIRTSSHQMRIPTEHFAHVPVALLSPSLLPSPEDEQQSFPRSLMARLVSPERSVSIRTSSHQMRIPTEHFAHVPVALLSPSLLPSPEDEQQSFPRSLMARLVSPERSATVENSVGSAPNSPASTRRHAAASAPGSRGASAMGFAEPLPTVRVDGPGSMPCVSTPLSSMSTLERRARYGRSVTGASAAERLRGVQMAVCHDCKAMVLQIIKSSRACRSASRDRALRHLTLDLAPVYTADC
ncbi:protein spire [Bicyclus anynana]|uniref:Protein spire n=1 Tax=Bicyclus anynana TaxID=110368 RepID=A0ABM3M6U7_BICAN|nr:protein spire [Bicyclus anynana]